MVRLLVIGIDAMSPERVREQLDDLPQMGRLASRGDLLDVTVRGDPCTPEVWTSFATGLPRECHPVRHLTVEESGQLWRADDLPAAYLPDRVLNGQGLTSGLFNIPVVTYPPRPTAGWMASGDMLYPQDIYPQPLRRVLEPYPPPSCEYYYPEDVPISVEMVKGKHCAIYREFVERGRVSYRNLISLLDYLVPDVVVAYWHFLDSIQHHLLCNDEMTAAAYRLVDEFIGKLVERCLPEKVLVVSDHGMRAPRESDDGEGLVRVGDWQFMQMRWERRHYLSSGVHSDRAICLASWPSDADQRPMVIEAILPWALRECGIDWSPEAGPATIESTCGDDMTAQEREQVLRRLRELGYA